MRTPSERLRRSMTSDNLWLYILTLLKNKEMYPYEIREKIRDRFGFLPGNVTAYIVLEKLKAGGYVKIGRKEKIGGPERAYYKITQKGKTELGKAGKIFGEISKKLTVATR
jgi:DNA-binding PadR family transcriptional regulator